MEMESLGYFLEVGGAYPLSLSRVESQMRATLSTCTLVNHVKVEIENIPFIGNISAIVKITRWALLQESLGDFFFIWQFFVA